MSLKLNADISVTLGDGKITLRFSTIVIFNLVTLNRLYKRKTAVVINCYDRKGTRCCAVYGPVYGLKNLLFLFYTKILDREPF